MIRCKECGASNFEGSLFCAECGGFIVDFDPNSTTILPFSDFLGKPLPPPVATPATPTIPRPTQITIFIPSSRRRVQVTMKGEMRIGRADSQSGITPELDLTKDGGAENGVSRLHAIIRSTSDGLILFDLGSTNGTLLNAYRLPPHQPYPISSGDEIRFGDLLIHVFF